MTATIPTQSGDRWIGNNRQAILSGGDSTPVSFLSDGISNVTISGLVVEHFKSDTSAAIRGTNSSGWLIENNEVRDNWTTGISHALNTVVRNNFVHHNGQYGITGYRSVGAVIEGNEVSFNNTRGFNSADQGGSKWVGTRDITVRNNYYHDNFHVGIWLDANNHNSLVEGNLVEDNTWHGIHFEISCSGVIRNNTVTGNGQTGIFINASQNVDVFNNTVSGNANGIRVWAQDRGDGECNWIADNVLVQDNDVSMSAGFTGLQLSSGQSSTVFTNGRIRFVNNDYHVPNVSGTWFHWSGSLRTFSAWQGFGQDLAGSID